MTIIKNLINGVNMKKVIYDKTYKGKPILTDESKNQKCYKEILNRTDKLMTNAITKHNKVFYMRLDFRLPSKMHHTNDNKSIVNFMNSFNKHLSRQKLDPKYLWVREQSREKHQHYHAYLLLDGNKTQNIHNHIQKAEELWSRQLNLPPGNNGLVNDCTKNRNGEQQQNGIMIKRNSKDFQAAYNKAFEWSSYLAKEHTKQNNQGIRNFGSSMV